MKHSIVIVDDHVLIANAIRSIISDFEDFEVLYECYNGQELVSAFKDGQPVPKIVLLDVSMPIMDGFETAFWLKINYPSVLVLALSMQNDENSLIKMVRNGARGYLLKNTSPTELEHALHIVIKNAFYYPEWASNILFANAGKDLIVTSFSLNEKEKIFLSLCTTEMSYKEIGDKMSISTRTVEKYRDNLFQKLGLKSRVGLAMYAMKNNLI
jgi:DNA-binding NarL/FixJ family response regulator